ncbi:hypothetical protein Dimus_000776 [Dionaea muscipula]
MDNFPSHILTIGGINRPATSSSMEINQPKQVLLEDEDEFIKFIDLARSLLSPDDDDGEECVERERDGGPGWSWIASRVLKTCISYSSGVTSAILLSELSKAWAEQSRTSAPRQRPECISQLKKKHRRGKLPYTVTVDLIYEKNFLSLNSVLEAVIVDVFALPGTNIYMLKLGDFWSSNTIDLYLHRRYYDLVSTSNGILKKGREVFMTGCYLRTFSEGFGHPRLLPTEYLVILLDEDQDDDTMLLGAQFCSDTFACISLDAANRGVSYSLYARIDCIGPLETLKEFGGLQRKQITLTDSDGMELKFLLWGEQVLLANLFSVRSTLAIDRPFIVSAKESAVETCEEVCLEYGSATQLYLVPFIQQEEQVCVSLSQGRFQGSKMAASIDPSQGPKFSQVILPCDSQGSVDFSNYPFRSYITDLRGKMTGISLYGVVTDIFREADCLKSIFYMRIEDGTGRIWAKLHFAESWSLGRVGLGHTVYISGLTCCMVAGKRSEAFWSENDVGAYFVNVSCLPAMLNSSCLHKLSCLADLSRQQSGTHICRVWLDQSEQWHVNTRLAHASCGHFVSDLPSGVTKCQFCCCNCGTEVRRVFHLRITIADESAKVSAWCTGQTAVELLQISPDEFYDLPEEEQVMYPSSLENERYMIAILNCSYNDTRLKEDDHSGEITRSLKL